MTYRQRREHKAARLRGWASTRRERAAPIFEQAREFRGDYAFNTQPGHIPERARLIAREDRAYASINKATEMDRRASGIEDQAAHAIYSDDVNAVGQLTARIDEMEGRRAHMKAINAAIRAYEKRTGKANADLAASDLRACGVTSDDLGRFWPDLYGWRYPSYALANLSGNIKRQRDRLAKLNGRIV